jgi:ubiquinone/menaquinone biosynthesis C-methylase UbiE
MLRWRDRDSHSRPVGAAGEALPFSDGQFDGIVLINVLEHVTDLDATTAESARVLRENGVWLAVTPNGDWEFWLDLAERWSLKIPEGPHAFLSPEKLRRCLDERFEVLEHRTFLVLPAGPQLLSRWFDRITLCSRWNGGFFQFVAARKRSRPGR